MKVDIPLVLTEGRNEPFWLGGRGSLDWFYLKFQGIEIGNERYYEKVRYLTAGEVIEATQALSELKSKNAIKIWNTLYPAASELPDSGKNDFINFFNKLLNYLGDAVMRKNAILFYMT
ncbi:YfbM family protein [Trichocoleus sp. ST-U3]|uniref:DUF1877 family protein n=1 Tax=Coleofasciculus sp. FACHB-542 TaxID=2692787 RepID=UPI0016858594|nr:DUF1877 family protein [Coleofasciculus sp. FACHB-542]MBD2086703.1 hypothetical protein [Coleofasciculus sp. FACHB-542]